MHRNIHYEAAFEDYLRSQGVPYVPVDESRKAIFGGTKVKSFDFIVYPHSGPPWIVDIKGRKFPYESGDGSKRYWENWITEEDLTALAEWESVFGANYEARFVFAYHLTGPADRWPVVTPHPFRGASYGFLSVSRQMYEQACKRRSPRWETVDLARADFRALAEPVDFRHDQTTTPALP